MAGKKRVAESAAEDNDAEANAIPPKATKSRATKAQPVVKANLEPIKRVTKKQTAKESAANSGVVSEAATASVANGNAEVKKRVRKSKANTEPSKDVKSDGGSSPEIPKVDVELPKTRSGKPKASKPEKRQRRSSNADSDSSFTLATTTTTKKNHRQTGGPSEEEKDKSNHSNDTADQYRTRSGRKLSYRVDVTISKLPKKKPVGRPKKVDVFHSEGDAEDDELPVVMDKPTTSSTKRSYQCGVDGCLKLFKKARDLQLHSRGAHSEKKPYECTFPSCGYASTDLSNLKKHIRNVHKQSKERTNKKVKVRKEILDEVSKEFGIKQHLTGKVYGDKMSEDDDELQPTLPHFDTIHQTSTGHFICPLSQCHYQNRSMTNLKEHYRIHGGSDYRPFRCTFSEDCEFTAKTESTTKRHIRRIHLNVPESIAEWNKTADEKVINESASYSTRLDWLKKEDVLFSSAQIVTAPDVQIPRPFECTFPNCSKKFTRFYDLRFHLRSHYNLKPFQCVYPNCDQTSTQKEAILRHILSKHFKIKSNKHESLSKEEKQRAKKYFYEDKGVLDEEEAKLASIRTRKKPGRRERPDIKETDDKEDNEDGPFNCTARGCYHQSSTFAELKDHYVSIHC